MGHEPSMVERLDRGFDVEHRSLVGQIIHRFKQDKLGLVATGCLFAILLISIVGPALIPYDPMENDYGSLIQAPSVSHPFGTDDLGRDLLARTVTGARYSLLIGFGSILFASVLGISAGAIAGYTRRDWLDELVMRLMDVFIAFPAILLGIAFIGVVDEIGRIELNSLTKMILIIGLVYAPRFARVTRGAVMKERNKDYVRMARLDGLPAYKIFLGEISLNIISPLLVLFSYRVGSAMIVAAGLGFLGIGLQPPTPGWGVMIATGREFIVNGHWWMIAAPGIALSVTIMSLNLFGDAVRDALDPNISTLEEA